MSVPLLFDGFYTEKERIIHKVLFKEGFISEATRTYTDDYENRATSYIRYHQPNCPNCLHYPLSESCVLWKGDDYQLICEDCGHECLAEVFKELGNI